MRQDEEHLRLLAIFHYLFAGLMALAGLFPIIHLVMGLMMVTGNFHSGNEAAPRELGWLFIGVAVFMMAMFWGLAVALVVAGRSLQVHRRWTYCFVVACLACLNAPLGTALGVFTIIVLLRPSVQELFGVSTGKSTRVREDDDDEEEEIEPRRPRPRSDDHFTE